MKWFNEGLTPLRTSSALCHSCSLLRVATCLLLKFSSAGQFSSFPHSLPFPLPNHAGVPVSAVTPVFLRLVACGWTAQPCQGWPWPGSPMGQESCLHGQPLDGCSLSSPSHKTPECLVNCHASEGTVTLVATDGPQAVSMWSEVNQILRAALAVTYQPLFCLSFSSEKWE